MQRPQEGASGGEAKGTGRGKGISEAARVLIPKAFVSMAPVWSLTLVMIR